MISLEPGKAQDLSLTVRVPKKVRAFSGQGGSRLRWRAAREPSPRRSELVNGQAGRVDEGVRRALFKAEDENHRQVDAVANRVDERMEEIEEKLKETLRKGKKQKEGLALAPAAAAAAAAAGAAAAAQQAGGVASKAPFGPQLVVPLPGSSKDEGQNIIEIGSPAVGPGGGPLSQSQVAALEEVEQLVQRVTQLQRHLLGIAPLPSAAASLAKVRSAAFTTVFPLPTWLCAGAGRETLGQPGLSSRRQLRVDGRLVAYDFLGCESAQSQGQYVLGHS